MVMNQNKDPTNIKEAWTENLVNDLTTPQSISGHSLFPIQANPIQSNNYISKPKHYNSFLRILSQHLPTNCPVLLESSRIDSIQLDSKSRI